jgi:hypothetical protein
MIKYVKKFNLGEEPETDLEYWLTKTPIERLAALEKMRQNYITFFLNGNKPRFQRIYTVVK